jgi:hypothetical protein
VSSAPLHSGREASFHALGALRQINRMGFLETPEKNGRRLRQAMPAALDLSPLGLRELS